ncbi:MAG: hypothetical protein K2O44_04275 [Clostridia bacterium]|nr:hypothetical protein [Clostridia bacterium]
MDIKKYLQQKAEEDASSVLSESDKEYCKAIAQQSDLPPRNRYNRKFWVCISCAVCVLLAAVITIAVIFAPKKPIMYFEDKIVSRISAIDELNADSQFFSVDSSDSVMSEIKMYYDEESGDKLYYRVNLDGFFEKSTIILVINKNYTYPFDELSEISTEPLEGYTLNYSVDENFDNTQYTGWIQLKTETVYITYTQKLPLGDQAFFTYVQSVVQAK